MNNAVPSELSSFTSRRYFVKENTLEERFVRDIFCVDEVVFVEETCSTGTTVLLEAFERFNDHKQNAFSNTSARTSVTKTRWCLIDVIMTERQISCIMTPKKLKKGNLSDPNVFVIAASALYSNHA